MNLSAYNIRTRKDKKTKIQHLIIEGDVGINYIDQIKSGIESLKLDNPEIVIELKNIDSIDLSTVQLVYSLKKTLEGSEKKVKIVSDIPEDYIPLLRNAGFDDLIKS